MEQIVTGAVVGGLAGKFAEKAWDSGQKWLSTYFQNHSEKVQEQAKLNSLDFLTELAKRVKALEESNPIYKQQIEAAQDRPDFSGLLKQAILNSSETQSSEKHILLARLVSQKLIFSQESTWSLASKMACEAISSTNTRQLKILGLQTTLLSINPVNIHFNLASKEELQKRLIDWLISRLTVYHDLQVKDWDLIHLEALSCLKFDRFLGDDLGNCLSRKVPSLYGEDFQFNMEKFQKCDIGSHVFNLWNNFGLKSVSLTSVGNIIGVYVSDMVTGSNTTIEPELI